MTPAGGPEEDPREKARQKAWRLLQIRPHSERELWRKLRERGFHSDVLEDVFAELKRCRYLDDPAYALQKARHLAMDRLLGDRRIVCTLREKGLDAGLIAKAVAEIRETFPETEALRRLIRRKIQNGTFADPDDRTMQKMIQSLWGRGFSTGLILEILKSMKEEEDLNDQSGV